jgi:hypothetical protein
LSAAALNAIAPKRHPSPSSTPCASLHHPQCNRISAADKRGDIADIELTPDPYAVPFKATLFWAWKVEVAREFIRENDYQIAELLVGR